MKELETEFTGTGEVKGMSFFQIQKSDKGYIYQVGDTLTHHYEVFRRKENNRFNSISYPKSKSFGKWAWTFLNYENALQKFNEL